MDIVRSGEEESMKKAVVFGCICASLTMILYCSLTNDNTRIEGNWWQNSLVGPGGTVSADGLNSSSNLTSFNPDRTYSYSNPFTGDQQTGTWTIDQSLKLITVYLNPVGVISNSNYTISNLVISNRYDFPDTGTLKLINPTNSVFYTLFKKD
jgi:hypothetical protein